MLTSVLIDLTLLRLAVHPISTIFEEQGFLGRGDAQRRGGDGTLEDGLGEDLSQGRYARIIQFRDHV